MRSADSVLGSILEYLDRDPATSSNPGKHVEDFEAALSDFFGVSHAIAVSSGTAAIHCALNAVGIGPGDEVLVPALSLVMSVSPLVHLGATPVFVDMANDNVDFDYADLERKIGPKTKAILPVYLWGYCYDLDRLASFATEHQIAIVEDACQAHGSRWRGRYAGTIGQAGCFSLRDGKLMSTGEGGFVLTNLPDVAAACRAFRNHWSGREDPRGPFSSVALNYRLSDIQALLGKHELSRLPTRLAMRHHMWAELRQSLDRRFESLRRPDPEESNLYGPVILSDGIVGSGSFGEMLSRSGVPNSVGSFGLTSADRHEIFESGHYVAKCPSFLERCGALILGPDVGPDEAHAIATAINNVDN